jgi:hypothetical protein
MSDFDIERVRVRNVLIERANDSLGRLLEDRTKIAPVKELAAFIAGSEHGFVEVIVARRDFIAKKLRERDPSPECAALAQMVIDAPKDGAFLPCAFVVVLDPKTVDLSVVMLRNEGVS